MKFTHDFIEKVQEANNLLDIISQYTQLRPMGSGYMGKCPFPDHQEKTASFSVSEVKQVYHCFGCQKKGNIFTFVQDYNGMSFPEAVEYLALKAAIPLPVHSSDDYQAEDKKKKNDIKELNKLAAEFFQQQLQNLPKDHPAHVYLKKRNILPETQKLFCLGYAGPEWDQLVLFLQSKGLSLKLADEAKLIKQKKQSQNDYFDLFRDRIMFPIFNIQNEVVAFGGRVILQGEPKYLNSPETPVFHKGKMFYGLNWTGKHIRSEDQVYVVEGYMDLISLYQSGVKPVVATMGTALTLDHGKILKRLTNQVIALFDGDSAGQEAAERSLPLLLQSETWPKGLILPNNMDPDDFIKEKGLVGFQEWVKTHGQDLFSLVLQKKLQGYKAEPAQKIRLMEDLQPLFQCMKDPRLKELYIQEVGQKTNLDKIFLQKNLLSAHSTEAQRAVVTRLAPIVHEKTRSIEVVSEEKLVLKGVTRIELFVLSLVLKNRANFKKYLDWQIKKYFLSPVVINILNQAEDSSRQSLDKFDKFLSLLTLKVDEPKLLFTAWDHLSEETQQGEDIPSLKESEDETGEEKILKDSFKKLKIGFFQKKAEELTLAIKIQPTPEKLEEFMSIQKERIQLNKEEL